MFLIVIITGRLAMPTVCVTDIKALFDRNGQAALRRQPAFIGETTGTRTTGNPLSSPCSLPARPIHSAICTLGQDRGCVSPDRYPQRDPRYRRDKVTGNGELLLFIIRSSFTWVGVLLIGKKEPGIQHESGFREMPSIPLSTTSASG